MDRYTESTGSEAESDPQISPMAPMESEVMQRRMQIIEGIARGERAILENRTYSQDEAKAGMQKRLA